jgi:cytochrome c oxidase cbb3-type subunit 2
MKSGPIFFIGLLGALGIPWSGLVLSSNVQLGGLRPYYDDGDSQSYPLRPSGMAAAGERVYRDLECAACHTQQVRRPGFGNDQDRGWGDRQSVARDYIFRSFALVGQDRIGPDLANLAGRKPSAPDAEDLMKLLYAGQGGMPAYPFLFEERAVAGERSAEALPLVGRLEPPPGREIVPTSRAEALVAYLLSLNTAYDYPEARPGPQPAEKKKAGKP